MSIFVTFCAAVYLYKESEATDPNLIQESSIYMFFFLTPFPDIAWPVFGTLNIFNYSAITRSKNDVIYMVL